MPVIPKIRLIIQDLSLIHISFSIAMIAATNAMSGGSMVAAPGLSYAVGFASPLIYYSGLDVYKRQIWKCSIRW